MKFNLEDLKVLEIEKTHNPILVLGSFEWERAKEITGFKTEQEMNNAGYYKNKSIEVTRN